jgi:hypothetical protein
VSLHEVLGTEPAPWWVKVGGICLIGLLLLRSLLRS